MKEGGVSEHVSRGGHIESFYYEEREKGRGEGKKIYKASKVHHSLKGEALGSF